MTSLVFTLPHLIAFEDPTYKPTHNLYSGSADVAPGTTHFMGIVPVMSFPSDVPTSPNLRKQNLNTAVAKQMRESLLANDGDFHLKNKGITLLASSVRKNPEGGYEVTMDPHSGQDGDGILDGGHTYATIQRAISATADLQRQYVFVWIRVNVRDALKASIAEALNNTAAVSTASLANRRDEFGWLKSLLGPERSDRIAWQQNESGKSAKVEELIAQLYAGNMNFKDMSRDAYGSRAKTLSAFRRDPDAFTSHSASVLTILGFFEFVQFSFADRVQALLGDRAIEKKASLYAPIYDSTLEPQKTRVSRSVALVLLGGLEALLVPAKEDAYTLDRSLQDIVDLYNANWPVIAGTLEKSWNATEVGGDPGAFGKREETWLAVRRVIAEAADATPPQHLLQGPAPTYDPFKALGLSSDELTGFWSEDLEEARNDLEAMRAELADSTAVELTQSQVQERLALADNRKQRVIRIEDALSSISRDGFGFCRSCRQKVEIERLFVAWYALSCSRCG